jgi:MFS family permease
MKPFTALLGAAAGTHAADQLALATLPLTATLVLGAGPGVLGLLVAAQSAAWLLLSLPAGAWVDRMPRRTLLIVALGLGLAASVFAVAAAAAGIVSLLGVAAFVGASGTVVYVLTSISLLPALVPPADLSRSNARLELARAIVSLAAPFVAGLLAQLLSPTWGYALAAFGAALALACVLALPKASAPTSAAERPSFVAPSRPAPASWCATSCCAASASARSSGTSPFSPCSPFGRRWHWARSASIRHTWASPSRPTARA